MRKLHIPSACWLGSGTCSATVIQSVDYLGVQRWPTAEMFKTSSCGSVHGFQSQREQFQCFITGYRNNYPVETTTPHSQQTPISETSLLRFGKLGVINQLFCLLGQGNWKDKLGL